MDTLALTWTMPNALPGVDADAANPLSRALNRLVNEGRPFKRLSICFFKDQHGLLRWFGVLVHSAADRVVFFPGFTEICRLQIYRGTEERCDAPFDFDHITLEANRYNWHVTSSRSKDHWGALPTLALGQDRVMWFGLSLANANVLRPVRTETKIVCMVPSSDSRRRAQVLEHARDDAQFPIIALNDEHPPSTGWEMLHFALIAGAHGFADYTGNQLGFPHGSPLMVDPLPGSIDRLPLRSHRLVLSLQYDLQVVACALPGKLAVPITLTVLGG